VQGRRGGEEEGARRKGIDGLRGEGCWDSKGGGEETRKKGGRHGKSSLRPSLGVRRSAVLKNDAGR